MIRETEDHPSSEWEADLPREGQHHVICMIISKTKKAKATTNTAASSRGGCANDSDNRHPLATPRVPQKKKGCWNGKPKGDKGTKAKDDGKKGTKAAKAKTTPAEML